MSFRTGVEDQGWRNRSDQVGEHDEHLPTVEAVPKRIHSLKSGRLIYIHDTPISGFGEMSDLAKNPDTPKT
jgi:hypothetical protein